jgi:catechol 2,3-dioxygenase-like lactoylglutathione lyase family enzyme
MTDAASARRSYGEMLGLAERAGHAASLRGSDRRASAGRRIVYTVGPRQHILLEPGLPAGENERLLHVAYETLDVKALEAYFTSRGVRVLRPDERCGDSAIHVMDPDGHAIEFV